MPDSDSSETKPDPTVPPAADDTPSGEDSGPRVAPSPDEGPPDLAARLAAAQAEAAANFDRFARATADLENFRRRSVREKDELRAVATGRVLEDLFPVLDNLARAVAAARQPGADVKGLLGGVEMVLAQFKTALTSHGLTEIAPEGERFDPHQHEAIAHQPSEKLPEEHVLTVVRSGFALNGRLLRPASVVVSSGPPQEGKS